MSDPRFSIVIAAYNEQDVIASALESVRLQTREDWEALIVDDGSTDATADRVAPFLEDRRFRLLSQQNAGLPGARNAGIAAARGEYVSFLDSDDLLTPPYLERMGAALDADPGAGFAYTDAWAFDTDARRFRRKTACARNHPPVPPPTDPHETIGELIKRNYLWVAATVPRELLERLGGFDVEMRHCEDLDLWIRILLTGKHGVQPPGILGIKRVGSGQMSSDSPAVIEYLLLITGRIAGDEELPGWLREIARERIAELTRLRDALAGSDPGASARLRRRLALGGIYRRIAAPYVWRRRPPKEVRESMPGLAERLGVRQAARTGPGEVGRGPDVEHGGG